MDMAIDTKTQQHMKECNDLINLITSSGEGYTDEFMRRCRKQLREVIGQLWKDHENHMMNKAARTAIWTCLHNGLGALRVE